MSESIIDQRWREDSLCGQTDPEIFFPETGDYRSHRIAKVVCSRCVAVDDCRVWGIENPQEFGIIGGLSQKERRELARGLKLAH